MNNETIITLDEIARASAMIKFPKPRYTRSEAVRIALERFVARPNMKHCAPSVLMTLQEAYDLPGGEMMQWVANSFQGGVCSGEICGALSGAAMALGIMAYQALPHSERNRRIAAVANVANIQELTSGFKEKYGSLQCRVLLGRDQRTPEENERFSKERGWEKTCGRYVAYVISAMVKE